MDDDEDVRPWFLRSRRDPPPEMPNLSGDNEMPGLLDELEAIKMEQAKLAARREALEASLKAKIGNAEHAYFPGWMISWKSHYVAEHTVRAKDVRQLRVRRLDP